MPDIAGLTLRPVTEADTGVLLGLFCQDRAPVLLRMQFKARQQHLATRYPDAFDHLLQLDGRPVGRLMVSRSLRRGDTSLRVVDLVVDRRERRQGLATAALTPWLRMAAEQRLPVTARVDAADAARSFFAALGFRADGDPRHDDPGFALMRLDPRDERQPTARLHQTPWRST